MMIRVAFGNSYKWAQSASGVTLVLDSASVTLVQGLIPVALEQDSASPCFIYGTNIWPLKAVLMSNYLPISILRHEDTGHWGKGRRPLWFLLAGQGCQLWKEVRVHGRTRQLVPA